MDRADLAKVSQLDGEARMLHLALESFDAGGVIVGLSVSRGPLPEGEDRPAMPPMMSGIQVPTVGMQYPQQMVDQIKQGLHQRLDQIESEMQGMGVTGEPLPRAAGAAAAPAAPIRRRGG